MERAPRNRRAQGGFTLVELMVAVTGGLFISLAVFALASDASRFYRSESRISDATMNALVGFERLRNDIARAGFLATPNVLRDPRLCGDPVADPSWPTELKRLASLRIEQGGSPGSGTLTANGLSPDSITLAGSYSSVDEFPVWNVQNTGANFIVFLQKNAGPLARLGYNDPSTDQVALLTSLFGPGRALRIVDQAGEIQFATIEGVAAGTSPQVILTRNPILRFREGPGNVCGLKGNVTGAMVNVVNFVRYDVRNLKTQPATVGATTAYAPVYGNYGDPAAAAWEADRTELVRVELDTSGNAIEGTEELVAELAVDFKLGLTVVQNVLNNTDPTLQTFVPGDSQIANFASDITGLNNPNQGPQRVRAVRVRFSVRSRIPDRDGPIVGASGTPVAVGTYRVGLGPGGTTPFARVRTLQADVTLNNQVGKLW